MFPSDNCGAGLLNTRLLSNITDLSGYPARGCYTNPVMTYKDRLKILKVANYLATCTPSIKYEWTDVLRAKKSPWGKWDGKLSSIGATRCDGVVEVSYEINGIMVWGMYRKPDKSYNYDITSQSDKWTYSESWGTWKKKSNGLPDNLEEHNDLDSSWDWDDTLMPATQAGYVKPVDAKTTFKKQNLCKPVGSTGGN